MASWCDRCTSITAMPTDDCGGSEDFPWELCPMSTGKALSPDCLMVMRQKFHEMCEPADPLTAAPLPESSAQDSIITSFSPHNPHSTNGSGESIYLIIVVILIILIFNLFVCLASYFYCCTNIFRRKKAPGLVYYDHQEPVRFDQILGGERGGDYNRDASRSSVRRQRSYQPRADPRHSRFAPNFSHPQYGPPPNDCSGGYDNSYGNPNRSSSRSGYDNSYGNPKRSYGGGHSSNPDSWSSQPPPPPKQRGYDVLFDGRKLEHNRDKYQSTPRSQSERRSHSASRRNQMYRTLGELQRSKSNPAIHQLHSPLRERIQQSSFSQQQQQRSHQRSRNTNDFLDESEETGVSFIPPQPSSIHSWQTR